MANAQQQCESRHYYVGATIDNRYQLTNFIGAGGMACVYRAHEIGSPHEFALKFLKDEFHNLPYLVEYFQREASSMRDLAHPNIVRFYRFVNHEDYSYIIMDYVDGFSLSDVLKLARAQKQPMPLNEVIRVMVQVARALDTIHRERFVHRDIKPSNVLIARKSGQAFLTDLGIASAEGVKIEGAGTIAYMAPEQSETWVADQRSDVYAYGILLYEMLTGERPFDAKSGLVGSEAEADLLRKHKESPVPDVTARRRDLPAELNGIIAHAMAKQPDDRYQSVVEFARDVHDALRPQLADDLQEFATIQHRQIAAPDSPPAPEPQNILRLLLVIGVAAILLASLIASSVFFEDGFGLFSTATPTATHTPLPTFTPTENPIEGVTIRLPFLQGVNAFSEPDATDRLLVEPQEGEFFNYLRVGFVGGFRVVMDIASTDNVTRYGLAFRMQDRSNYYYFAVNPTTLNWQMVEVVDGISTVQRSGELNNPPEQLTVAGLGDFFEIRSGSTVITFESNAYPIGSLAVYVEAGSLVLDDIQVSLLGDEARQAVITTPTPSQGLADPLRFLRDDVEAMIATNLPLETAINCPPYIAVYETLERHLDSSNTTVVRLARNVQSAGQVVYQRCLIESPNGALGFNEFVQDYSEWETNLSQILSQLNS
ncbi:MAG: serine/threonine-protein kinase [Anaerolineae bacterium]